MFLIRAAFWLSLVILLIPGNPESGEDAPRVGALQALSAAQAAVADMTYFCDRNPDVCTTGGAALKVFANKAKNGARLIYDYFGDAEDDRGTLQNQDVQPDWRGTVEPDQSA